MNDCAKHASTIRDSYLEILHLGKTYGTTVALSDFTLEVSRGDFIALVGPSGCGKSTALRLIAGLESPSNGSLRLQGVDITKEDPSKRNIAMVFQDYALYPHLSVFDNIAFPLKIRRLSRKEILYRVNQIAGNLDIADLLDRKPGSLSGGQQQRVAIARALVRRPSLFLMDEPLSNLDAKLRVQMRGEMARLHTETGATIIYVTHDQTEALSLANKVVVLNAGKIQQIGTPLQLYQDPANCFVAGFIGTPPMNLLPGYLYDDQIKLIMGDLSDSHREIGFCNKRKVVIGVRPEHFKICHSCSLSALQLPAKAERTEFTGSESLLFVNAYSGTIAIRITEEERQRLIAGMQITIGFNPDDAFVFSAATGARINYH